jgi:hypothetical protein
MAPAIEDRGQLEVVLTGVADDLLWIGSIQQSVRDGHFQRTLIAELGNLGLAYALAALSLAVWHWLEAVNGYHSFTASPI